MSQRLALSRRRRWVLQGHSRSYAGSRVSVLSRALFLFLVYVELCSHGSGSEDVTLDSGIGLNLADSARFSLYIIIFLIKQLLSPKPSPVLTAGSALRSSPGSVSVRSGGSVCSVHSTGAAKTKHSTQLRFIELERCHSASASVSHSHSYSSRWLRVALASALILISCKLAAPPPLHSQTHTLQLPLHSPSQSAFPPGGYHFYKERAAYDSPPSYGHGHGRFLSLPSPPSSPNTLSAGAHTHTPASFAHGAADNAYCTMGADSATTRRRERYRAASGVGVSGDVGAGAGGDWLRADEGLGLGANLGLVGTGTGSALFGEVHSALALTLVGERERERGSCLAAAAGLAELGLAAAAAAAGLAEPVLVAASGLIAAAPAPAADRQTTPAVAVDIRRGTDTGTGMVMVMRGARQGRGERGVGTRFVVFHSSFFLLHHLRARYLLSLSSPFLLFTLDLYADFVSPGLASGPSSAVSKPPRSNAARSSRACGMSSLSSLPSLLVCLLTILLNGNRIVALATNCYGRHVFQKALDCEEEEIMELSWTPPAPPIFAANESLKGNGPRLHAMKLDRSLCRRCFEHLLTDLLELAPNEQGSKSVVKALKEGGEETLDRVVHHLTLSLTGRQLIASILPTARLL
ncbi:hypothetical protein B0H19DRAFT_1256751 [Mycena capillaripes]|nr:hypothetical protein B0H19DRAFT_1256751 [Mycena capillaripes]